MEAIREETPLFNHGIGCILAFVHTPEVSLPEIFINSIKKWVAGFGKLVKGEADGLNKNKADTANKFTDKEKTGITLQN